MTARAKLDAAYAAIESFLEEHRLCRPGLDDPEVSPTLVALWCRRPSGNHAPSGGLEAVSVRASRDKKLREERDMSRAELAEAAKITREYVRRLEAGIQDPTLGTLQRIARALGVSIGDLVR